jgi:cytochrome c oxidase assembly protein subunit 15
MTLFLLYAGGFTTTIGAGMVFPDWPLSNGSLNPEGWTQDPAMAAEHSHRLLGMIVGNLTLTLAIWIWWVDGRRWMRRMGFAALVLVIIQGILGGMRVLENEVNYAIVHGCLAQVFFCSLAAVAIGQPEFGDDGSRAHVRARERTPTDPAATARQPAVARAGRYMTASSRRALAQPTGFDR